MGEDDESIMSEPEKRTGAEHPSPWRLGWLKFRQNRTAMFGLGVLTGLYAATFFAGFLAPYRYDNAAHDFPFHPPMISRLHIFDEQGRLQRPFVYGIAVEDTQLKRYREDRSVRYPVLLFARGDEYHILGLLRSRLHLFTVEEPGRLFLFGSDKVGQDLFSRLLYGAQVSLSIGVLGLVISTLLGLVIGGIAGYFGGAIDFLLMRIVEVLLAIPSLYVILILRQSFATSLSSTQIYLLIVILLSFIGWATEARVIRGMVLSIKERDYVVAARALGFGNGRIILRHILPNTLSFVIVTATLSVPFFILGEVALSFLGVGIQEPEASWGNLLRDANNRRFLEDFPWVLLPGVCIFIAVMAWNFFGDGLRDAFDPRSSD